MKGSKPLPGSTSIKYSNTKSLASPLSMHHFMSQPQMPKVVPTYPDKVGSQKILKKIVSSTLKTTQGSVKPSKKHLTKPDSNANSQPFLINTSSFIEGSQKKN